MAKTFLTGPVQSANGFQTVTKNATTGAVTATSTFGDDTTITGTMTQDISVVGTYTVATVPTAVAPATRIRSIFHPMVSCSPSTPSCLLQPTWMQ